MVTDAHALVKDCCNCARYCTRKTRTLPLKLFSTSGLLKLITMDILGALHKT